MRMNFKKASDRELQWLVYTTSPILRQTEYNFKKQVYEAIKFDLQKIFPQANIYFSWVADPTWGYIHMEFTSEADEAYFLLISSSGIEL